MGVPFLVGTRQARRLLQVLLFPDSLRDGRDDASRSAWPGGHKPRQGRQKVDLIRRAHVHGTSCGLVSTSCSCHREPGLAMNTASSHEYDLNTSSILADVTRDK